MKLECNKCGNELEIDYSDQNATCGKCGKSFEITTNEISHAVAGSGSCEFYKFNEDNLDTIERRYFQNQPLDTLEAAYQDTLALDERELRAAYLIPVIKEYHDALRMRLQRFLTLSHVTTLSNEEKEIITKNPHGSTVNLNKLLNYLRRAFPSNIEEINAILLLHNAMIKRILWVRHKSEHPIYTLWKIPANIYEDLEEGIDSKNNPKDILNYNFVVKANNAVIDIYILTLKLDPQIEDKWQLSQPEHFRINKTTI
jgi:hypothetical protein